MNRNTTVVTYNEVSEEPFTLSASCMMTNNLCFKGFNMNSYEIWYEWIRNRWLMNAPSEAVKKMVDELAASVANNSLKIAVTKEKLENVTSTMQCKCQRKCTCGKTEIPVLCN